MKKTLASLMLLCLLTLTACSPTPAVKGPTILPVHESYQKLEGLGILPPMVEVPEDMVLDFYGIAPEWYSQAVFMVSEDSLLADEVVLISAKDDKSVKEIEAMLTSRLDFKAEEARSYSPQQFDIIKKGWLVAQGLDIALLVSPQADSLLAAWQGK